MTKLLLLMLLAPGIAYAQSYDTTASSGGSSPAGTPQTFSLTVASNNNRVLYVGVILTGGGGGTNEAPSAVSYNSDAMSAVSGGDVGNSEGTTIRVTTYKLAAPDTGTHDVSITWSSGSGIWAAMAVSLYNADQTTMHRTVSSLSGATSDGLSTLPPTSVSGDMVIDFIGWRFSGQNPAEGAGQTENVCEQSGIGLCIGQSSRETAAGATTTMSWTWDAMITDSSHVAFAVIPVASSSTAGSTLRRRRAN